MTDSTGLQDFIERFGLYSKEQQIAAGEVVQKSKKISTRFGCRLPISMACFAARVWSQALPVLF